MPLVNVVPHMVLHQQMHFLVSVYFLGRWKGLPAPCEELDILYLMGAIKSSARLLVQIHSTGLVLKLETLPLVLRVKENHQ